MIKATQRDALANPEAVKEMAKWINGMTPTHVVLSDHYEWGTLGAIGEFNKMGGVPTNNFQGTNFEGMDKIDEFAYVKNARTEKVGCYACGVKCKSKVKFGPPYNVSDKYGGPEWETLSLFGANCGVDDLGAICKASEICNAYGADHISVGTTISFAMECFEKGLLTEKDTGGLKLTFGNAEALMKATEMICKREGIGDLLAEGVARAAKQIGKGAEKYAMHSKGTEFPMHNPYVMPIVGLGYALSPTGADHLRNMMFGGFLYGEPGPAVEALAAFGLLEPLPAASEEHLRNPGWLRMYTYTANWYAAWDCMGLCNFLGNALEPHHIAQIVRDITGWNVDGFEVMKLGERCQNMMRAFNIREGFTREDDRIPDRFFEPLKAGSLKGAKLDKNEFEKSKSKYYEMMSWGEAGIPKRDKLQELGIEWLADMIGVKK